MISVFGSAIIFPHFLHFMVLRGSYIGMKILTLGSWEGCSRNILFTGTLFQYPQLEHFIFRFTFKFWLLSVLSPFLAFFFYVFYYLFES